MNDHLLSVLGLLGFVLAMVILIRRTGRPRVPVKGLWVLLVCGYVVTGARFVQTMAQVDWIDGLVGFIALCSALPIAGLIRRLCPSCRRGLTLTEAVLRTPSRRCPGVGVTSWCCQHCGHHVVQSHTIPSLAEMASEAVPWVPESNPVTGYFGGTYSAGSSGGVSWSELAGPSESPAAGDEGAAGRAGSC